MALVTLLTDFGDDDYYVGAVRGTLLRLAPGTQLADLSHRVVAGDIAAGADLLAAAAPTFPAGTLHLAVIDPGVGSDRRILAAEAGGHWFVGPDNGLLIPALEALGGGWHGVDAVAVDRPDLFLDAPGETFHGRDRFAPVAAALARGELLDELGEPLTEPVRLPEPPEPRRHRTPVDEDDTELHLEGHLTRIDRFGNLITDLPAGWLGTDDDPVVVVRTYDGPRVVETWVSHYAALDPGEIGALIGSRGTVELSLRDGDLADEWGLDRADLGATVEIMDPGTWALDAPPRDTSPDDDGGRSSKGSSKGASKGSGGRRGKGRGSRSDREASGRGPSGRDPSDRDTMDEQSFTRSEARTETRAEARSDTRASRRASSSRRERSRGSDPAPDPPTDSSPSPSPSDRSPSRQEAEMTRWEYKIINIRSENYRLDPAAADRMSDLGEDGWELVSITSVNFKTGATDNIAMVFKRPVD